MNEFEEDDVVFKFLHTADWHLGRRFLSFSEKDRPRLTRARLDTLDRVFHEAVRNQAQAILCAGDLFDEPDPGSQWWEPLARKLSAQDRNHPIFLLPGNHDPLEPSSVYHPSHPFRRALPSWVQVVDRDEYSYDITPEVVLYATPCRSRSGQEDPTAWIPPRQPGDQRIRLGLVHGSTFDSEVQQCNFPIARDAVLAKGLDYLAVGDHHSYRVVAPNSLAPTVYPGTHEGTTFGEREAGTVCMVRVRGERRCHPEKRSIAQWTWDEVTCRSMADLRALRDGPDRKSHVLRLVIDMRVPAADFQEAERILRELEGTEAVTGRVGILQLDRTRMLPDTSDLEALVEGLPPILRATAERLKAKENGPQAEEARRALMHLYRVARG